MKFSHILHLSSSEVLIYINFLMMHFRAFVFVMQNWWEIILFLTFQLHQ